MRNLTRFSKFIRIPSRDDTLLAVGVLVLVSSLLMLVGIPVLNHLEARARLVAVKGNAATLQLAVESFARQHMGNYPTDVAEVLTYLPQAKAPTNPLDGKPLQFAPRPGDVTYTSLGQGCGYRIKAWIYGPQEKCRELITLKGGSAMTGGVP